MSRSTRSVRSRLAYTLIEVLVVVTIIGIASAIVVPHMLRSGTLGVQAAARIIVADLMFAQNEAIAAQAARRVYFDVANNQYRIAAYDVGTGTWETIHVNWMSGGGGNYVIDFDADTRFQGVELVSTSFDLGGDPALEFDDLGAPSQGGNVVVRFENTRYRISVAAFTGRVTVEEI